AHRIEPTTKDTDFFWRPAPNLTLHISLILERPTPRVNLERMSGLSEAGEAGSAPHAGESALARRIGLFDATILVMGGIVGSGIFVAPAIVARSVQAPVLILGAWLVGGVMAVLGAFVYSELASHRPHVGGQYAYIREAYHPLLAFLYGWALLLVIQSGGM